MANKSPSLALIISNEYGNIPSIKLNGCYNDADNFINSIKKINPNTKFIIMKDNVPKDSPLFPSRKNIITQLNSFCCSPEIISYLYYSGHGSSVRDINGDESKDLVGITNAKKQRDSNNLSNGQFNDSCIVTNEGSTYGFLIDDEINSCFKNVANNKRIYAFFDSCNSGTIIDLYSIFFTDPKNKIKFTSKTIPELLVEMNNPKNKTGILSAYYPKRSNDIKGIIILLSGTRDNTYSYEGNNLGTISGNFTSRLCWLLNNGIGKMTLNDFYLSLVGIINNVEQLPVITCSKFISITKTTMADFDNGQQLSNTPIPFLMNTLNNKEEKALSSKDYESDTDYDTSDDELLVVDQLNNTISIPVTEIDNEIKEQLAKADEIDNEIKEQLAKANEIDNEIKEQVVKANDTSKKEAENKAKKEADAKAKKEADEKAKKEAKAKKDAEDKVKKEAEDKTEDKTEDKVRSLIQTQLNDTPTDNNIILLAVNKAKKHSVHVTSNNNIVAPPTENIDLNNHKSIDNNIILRAVNNARKQNISFSSNNNIVATPTENINLNNTSNSVSGAQFLNYLRIKKQ